MYLRASVPEGASIIHIELAFLPAPLSPCYTQLLDHQYYSKGIYQPALILHAPFRRLLWTERHPRQTQRFQSKADKPKPNASKVFLTLTRTHFRLFITAVTACLITIPAFSVSFFVSPVVTHTFKAGCAAQSTSRGVAPRALGIDLRRVIRTPFAKAWIQELVSHNQYSQNCKSINGIPRQRNLVASSPGQE